MILDDLSAVVKWRLEIMNEKFTDQQRTAAKQDLISSIKFEIWDRLETIEDYQAQCVKFPDDKEMFDGMLKATEIMMRSIAKDAKYLAAKCNDWKITELED